MKTALPYVFLITILITCSCALWYVAAANRASSDALAEPSGEDKSVVRIGGKEHRLSYDVGTCLIIGTGDDESVSGIGAMKDSPFVRTLTLIAVDDTKHSYGQVHIDPDTMTDIAMYARSGEFDCNYYMQLALGYMFGEDEHAKCKNECDAVSNVFGNLAIDSYYALPDDNISVSDDGENELVITLSDNAVTNMDSDELESLTGKLSEYEKLGDFTPDGWDDEKDTFGDGIIRREYYIDEGSVEDILMTLYPLNQHISQH